MLKKLRERLNDHEMFFSFLRIAILPVLVAIFTWVFVLDSRVDALPDKYISKNDFQWIVTKFTEAVDKRIESLERAITRNSK